MVGETAFTKDTAFPNIFFTLPKGAALIDYIRIETSPMLDIQALPRKKEAIDYESCFP